MRRKDIRGFEIEIGFELFKRTIFIGISPFKWRKPILSIPKKEALCAAPHLYVGPIHVWIFGGGATFGVTVDIDYNPFFFDKLTVPKSHKRIF